MEPVKVFIGRRQLAPRIGYILDVLSMHTGIRLVAATDPHNASVEYTEAGRNSAGGKLFLLSSYQYEGPLGLNENSFLREFNNKVLRTGIEREYDLLGICFYLITLMDENLDNRRDQWGCYSGEHSLMNNYNLLGQPVVDIIFKYLHGLMRRFFSGQIEDENNNKFSVVVTHDVDRGPRHDFMDGIASLSGSKSLKQTGFRALAAGYNFARYLLKDEFWSFDKWLSFEKKEGISSSFFVYSQSRQTSRHPYDPHYDISTDRKLADKLKYMLKEGFEIGLHGSYDSHNNNNLLEEKKTLEDVLEEPVYTHRSHYLRFFGELSWELFDRCGITSDSSVGYNEFAGFRAGTAKPFYPYDFKRERPFNVIEIPLTIMDGTLLQYKKFSVDEAVMFCSTIIDNLKVTGGVLVIDWHHDYWRNKKWKTVFKEIIRLVRARGGRFSTMRNIISSMQSCTQYAMNNKYWICAA